jgi:hypothetical protein
MTSTCAESDFKRLPNSRRTKAFTANDVQDAQSGRFAEVISGGCLEDMIKETVNESQVASTDGPPEICRCSSGRVSAAQTANLSASLPADIPPPPFPARWGAAVCLLNRRRRTVTEFQSLKHGVFHEGVASAPLCIRAAN